MQVVKDRLAAMAMSFTTPGLAVLYALIPWLPAARKLRQSNRSYAKVVQFVT